MTDKDNSEKIEIPSWAVTLFKFIAPAILAIGAAYLKLQSMDQTVTSHSEILTNAEKRCLERDNIVHQLSNTVNILSERQRNLENNTANILNITNQSIRELREELVRLREILTTIQITQRNNRANP